MLYMVFLKGNRFSQICLSHMAKCYVPPITRTLAGVSLHVLEDRGLIFSLPSFSRQHRAPLMVSVEPRILNERMNDLGYAIKNWYDYSTPVCAHACVCVLCYPVLHCLKNMLA